MPGELAIPVHHQMRKRRKQRGWTELEEEQAEKDGGISTSTRRMDGVGGSVRRITRREVLEAQEKARQRIKNN